MHEYSVASALLDQVALQAERHAATGVMRVQVRIGAASGVEPELLRSAWELVREGTLCGTAALELVSVPVRWGCPECCGEVVADGLLRCASCGAALRLLSGQELLLERIEMEVA